MLGFYHHSRVLVIDSYVKLKSEVSGGLIPGYSLFPQEEEK
jgi:hypothetical protein